ncbi:MAG: tryptophan-rich sensory protein [Candidatus Micrarchaeia archaeon]
MKNLLLALIIIVLLWISILLTIFSFYRESKIAAYLLIPYILWVSFALILNYYVYLMN